MVDTGVVDTGGALTLPVAAVPSPDSAPATSCWMMPLNAEATASAVKPGRGSREGVVAAAPVGAGGTTDEEEEDVLLLCRVPAGLGLGVGATEAGVGRDIAVVGVDQLTVALLIERDSVRGLERQLVLHRQQADSYHSHLSRLRACV